VATLTVAERASVLELTQAVSLDAICHRFIGDANRALVWLIRFRALTAWCERADIADWLHAEPGFAGHACAVAAGFELNDQWEFDTERFRVAVESACRNGGGLADGPDTGSE
jgi:hypothetical protein